jgi:hypothetical protein
VHDEIAAASLPVRIIAVKVIQGTGGSGQRDPPSAPQDRMFPVFAHYFQFSLTIDEP